MRAGDLNVIVARSNLGDTGKAIGVDRGRSRTTSGCLGRTRLGYTVAAGTGGKITFTASGNGAIAASNAPTGDISIAAQTPSG